jgi:hypothetical protein
MYKKLMRVTRLFALMYFACLGGTLHICAQHSTSCGYSAKNWRSLSVLASPTSSKSMFILQPEGYKKIAQYKALPMHFPAVPTGAIEVYSPVFLPHWSSADLPVFCRIEHEVGKIMPIMIKFRLGSVEYVDWLEGKYSKQ